MFKFQARNLFSLILFSLLTLTACNKTEEAAVAAESRTGSVVTETWEQFVTRQIEAFIAAHPQFAVTQGRHEYDGQLPDWSRAGIDKEVARLHQQRDEAPLDEAPSPPLLLRREWRRRDHRRDSGKGFGGCHGVPRVRGRRGRRAAMVRN